MTNNEKERKGLMEAIRILLRTTEELKIVFAPLCRGQEDALEVLDEHGESITSIMDKLIGTQEDLKKTLERLDLLRIDMSQLEERVESHEDVSRKLEKRLKRLEFEQVSQILEKIGKRKPLSVNDLRVVEDLLLLYPDDQYLLSVKSEILGGLDRKQEALGFLEEAISKYPNGDRLWYVKGLLLEDLDERLKCFDRSLELLKDGPLTNKHIVLHTRAILLASVERFKEALKDADKSVETLPDCYTAWILKGKILTELGRIPEALGCFENAIKLNKNRSEAWFEKGNALFVLGPDYSDEAMASYDKTLELDSKLAVAYFNKGKLLIRKELLDEALLTIDKGLEFDNEEPCGWCDRGVALNRLDRNEEALKSFEKALELDPPNKCYQIFIDMAIVLRNLERYKEALGMFDDVATRTRNLEDLSPEWLGFYAYLLYRNKQCKKGVGIARKSVEAEPETALLWNTLALNLQALGNDEEALETFEKALSLKESDEEITWDVLAKLYERMGRKKEAEQAYQKYESMKKEAKQANNVDQ
jgi:tetratricopeptide (TPR) repeat protein